MLADTLFKRLTEVKSRLEGRMGALADDGWYRARINSLDVKTLAVMVESGAWITREIGGEEVAVNVDVQRPQPRRTGPAPQRPGRPAAPRNIPVARSGSAPLRRPALVS